MITVEKIMKVPKLNELKLIAGFNGINKNVDYVTVMEVPDTIRWLKGNDFIITSLYAFKDDVSMQCNVLKELSKTSCAGMAIKLGQYVSALSPEFLDLATKYNIPIYIIPPNITYIDIIVNMTKYIYEEQNPRMVMEKYIRDIILETYTDDIIMKQRGNLIGYYTDANYYMALTLKFSQSTKYTAKDYSDLMNLSISLAQNSSTLKYISHGIAVNMSDSCTIMLDFTDKEHLPSLMKIIRESFVARTENSFPNLKVKIGCGKIHSGMNGIRQTYYESLKAISVGEILNSTNTIYALDEFEFSAVLLDLLKSNKSSYFQEKIHEISSPELLETLVKYFECNANVEKTSETMFLHKNTVKYRLQKLCDILNVDFKNTQDYFMLYLLSLEHKMNK